VASPKIIFAGTPDFAAAALAALFESGHSPCAVLTQPDRRAGRGKKLSPSPVKRLASRHGIPVLQPATLRDPDAVAAIAAFQPDIIVVAAYGLILPQPVLDLPRAVCLNIHASLLPRWRGAAPIQAAILAGDPTSGVCLMGMEAGLDTGPVYARSEVDIGSRETAGELHDRLAAAGAQLLVANIDAIVAGDLQPEPQQDEYATYAHKFSSDDAHLDWSEDAETLERRIRAFNPVPGAWFMLGDDRIKCWRASVHAGVDVPAGQVIQAGSDGVDVACGAGVLRLESLQRPGKRPVTGREFSSQSGDLAGRQL
jgi:methionyl-tRNA formyltransferase